MKILIIIVILLLIAVSIYVYIIYRQHWITTAYILFTRLVFFTVLMEHSNNKELRYNSEDLYRCTLQSNTWMMLRFWIWNFDHCIKNIDKFNYLTETTRIYKIEFSLYWSLFVINSIDLCADNIKKYNAVIHNTEFEKFMKNYNDISNLTATLH